MALKQAQRQMAASGMASSSGNNHGKRRISWRKISA